ncbi:hypothetical protein AJ87_46390 [Rhizobium yanglingense]|nr:hypothetical protein AJ87_46390 [Rhizobium yanglingense]
MRCGHRPGLVAYVLEVNGSTVRDRDFDGICLDRERCCSRCRERAPATLRRLSGGLAAAAVTWRMVFYTATSSSSVTGCGCNDDPLKDIDVRS